MTAALVTSLGTGTMACSMSDAYDPATDHSMNHKAGAPMKRSIPVGLRVPSMKVKASPVLKLGVDSKGNIEIPHFGQANKPGWYSHSVTPGENGVSVIVVRYNTPRGSTRLQNVVFLKVGEEIQVARADGKTAKFTITKVEQREVEKIALTSLDFSTRKPELRLIASGGSLLPKTSHHKKHEDEQKHEDNKQRKEDMKHGSNKKDNSPKKETDHYSVIFHAVLKK